MRNFPLCDFYGTFGLKFKAIFFQRKGSEDLASKRFVAGYHIAEVDVRKRVREQAKDPVADRMPKVQHTMRTR